MKKGFTLIELLVVIAIVLILAAILFPVFSRTHCSSRKASCQSNLKQISLGVMMYVQDYDELYPLIAAGVEPNHSENFYPNGVYGWADSLQPYLKSTLVFQCPSEITSCSDKAKPQQAGYTDYWLNNRLAGKNQKKLKSKNSIILLGDGNDGGDLTDATYSLGSLPGAWIKSKTSPAYRHQDGANYSFADGHVKWFKPQQISVEKPNGENATFRIQ
jgi:prepilin-type N-terminal cleavage/methylation domain-containing protein/prepilin-type processing-associated H-X9-DG protein